MKKYNLSNIMKRAWEIKKSDNSYIFGLCLKMAWEEAKTPKKSEKEILIDRLNEKVAEANSHDNGYHCTAYVSVWENYGKSRTYFSIYETRNGSKHNKKFSYGYYDNVENVYIPEKYGNLMDNYTIHGAAM